LPAKQKRVMDVLQAGEGPIEANRLASLADCTQAPLKSLAGKGLLVASKQRLHREQLDEQATEREQPLELNEDQEPALAAVLAACRSGQQQTILAYGVTGSGKTEVYMQAVEDVVRSGRQAIVLVPEISLTPQTRQRFRARFDQVAVLHSQLSDAERHWHWQRIADGQVQVVVGPRSAIFAPTPQLGLIVLDEEHEPSFKQETTPRYHARDVALERAKLEAIPLVLGSATPALESWQRAISGEFQLVRLPNRVLGRPLPEVATIDLCHERRSRSKGAISRVLEQAMRQALDQDGQIILLLNRRGFSTSIQCPACGHVVRCPQCDVAVTHHRQQVGGKAERVLCHYCDYEARVPSACPECRSEEIRFAGLGTQRLEAEVNARFRGSVCLRMDSDTMRGPGSHEKALQRFRDGEVQILVGTQMIAKGLDFPDVTLVGVVNADTALHFPDFRAAERTFQLVTQVAGRTGRSERGGRVLVQTYSPDHPAIQAAAGHQFEDFARQELPLREKFGYPPYSSLIRLIVRGDVEDATAAFAQRLVDELATLVADSVSYRVLGPAPAPITRVREKYRFHLLLVTDELSQLSEPLEQLIQQLPGPDTIQWVIDVDPLSLL
jgi:primosomal protein N' (replication factor Y)